MIDNTPSSLARLRRDEDIQSFFRGFEIPFRLDIACSPCLTPDQKRWRDADLRFRMSFAEMLARFVNALLPA